MKIKFNQPKYIIPLIIIPFNLLGFYVVEDTFNKDIKVSQLEESNSLNSNLPAANLDRKKGKDKFESFQEVYKKRQDFTAMQEIDLSKEDEINEKSLYTDEEKRSIDSIQTSIITGTRKDFMENVESKYKKNESYQPTQAPSKPRKKEKIESDHDKEMRLFKEQMMLIDSLTKSPEEHAAELQKKKRKQKKEEEKELKDELVQVSKSNSTKVTYFNTISANKNELFIRAIIDEGLKVFEGSRVRIRLMDDINAGDLLITKGTYLFGTVGSFSNQRVEITISSIQIDSKIVPVKLLVYDNDGLKGLYVPASKFRDFTKNLAATEASEGSSMNMEEDPQSKNQLFYGLAQKAISASAKATSKAARANRAKLKYNTIIYLVNPDDLKK